MDKSSFLFYLDYEEQLNLLTDEQIGQLMRAIIRYEKTKNISELDGMLKMAFSFIKTQLDRDREKYKAKCEKNKENAKKGGRPKKQTVIEKPNGFNKNQTVAKKADKEDEEDKDDDKDIEEDINKKEKKKKIKTFEDVFAENSISEELKNALKDFMDMRKTIKKPMTTKALELLFKNLKKLTNSEQEQIDILNQSIEHSWQTVYPLKAVKNNQKGRNK